MNKQATWHPTDGELLQYADGELSARPAKRVESHLEACWKCRTELAEVQKTIGDCVRYRRSVVQPGLPPPPSPWIDIYRKMERLDEAIERPGWPRRVLTALGGAVGTPRRWAPAIAVLVIAAVVVDHLRNAPSVRAAELLDKASVAEGSRPRAFHRIQIRTGSRTVTRAVADASDPNARADSPNVNLADAEILAGLQALFERADYSWEDPLSATSFANWRNRLADKSDEVTTVLDRLDPGRSRYRIRTSTTSSELTQATLQLQMEDLRPVEGLLEFRGHEAVEISGVADTLAVTPVPTPVTTPVMPSATPRPEPIVAESPLEIVRPATPGEELEVFAVLRRLGADLGEPVEVRRDEDQIRVTGVGVDPVLGGRIHEELAGLPSVRVEFSDPLPEPLPAARRTLSGTDPRPETAELQQKLEEQLGGRVAYELFLEEVLDTSDGLMSRVHALRRLAQRFPATVEAQLTAEDRRILLDLRRDHAVAVAGLAVTMEEQCRSAIRALGVPDGPDPPYSAPAGPWQLATEDLFIEARGAEAFLAAMLVGAHTETSPGDLPAATLESLARLRVRAASYARNALE